MKSKIKVLMALALMAIVLPACTTPAITDANGNACGYPRTANTIQMIFDFSVGGSYYNWALQAGNRWNNVQAQGTQPWFDGVNNRDHSEGNSVTIYEQWNPELVESNGFITYGIMTRPLQCRWHVTTVYINSFGVAGIPERGLWTYTHEFGHSLGLDHDLYQFHDPFTQDQCPYTSVMYFDYIVFARCGWTAPNGNDTNRLVETYD